MSHCALYIFTSCMNICEFLILSITFSYVAGVFNGKHSGIEYSPPPALMQRKKSVGERQPRAEVVGRIYRQDSKDSSSAESDSEEEEEDEEVSVLSHVLSALLWSLRNCTWECVEQGKLDCRNKKCNICITIGDLPVEVIVPWSLLTSTRCCSYEILGVHTKCFAKYVNKLMLLNCPFYIFTFWNLWTVCKLT